MKKEELVELNTIYKYLFNGDLENVSNILDKYKKRKDVSKFLIDKTMNSSFFAFTIGMSAGDVQNESFKRYNTILNHIHKEHILEYYHTLLIFNLDKNERSKYFKEFINVLKEKNIKITKNIQEKNQFIIFNIYETFIDDKNIDSIEIFKNFLGDSNFLNRKSNRLIFVYELPGIKGSLSIQFEKEIELKYSFLLNEPVLAKKYIVQNNEKIDEKLLNEVFEKTFIKIKEQKNEDYLKIFNERKKEADSFVKKLNLNNNILNNLKNKKTSNKI